MTDEENGKWARALDIIPEHPLSYSESWCWRGELLSVTKWEPKPWTPELDRVTSTCLVIGSQALGGRYRIECGQRSVTTCINLGVQWGQALSPKEGADDLLYTSPFLCPFRLTSQPQMVKRGQECCANGSLIISQIEGNGEKYLSPKLPNTHLELALSNLVFTLVWVMSTQIASQHRAQAEKSENAGRQHYVMERSRPRRQTQGVESDLSGLWWRRTLLCKLQLLHLWNTFIGFLSCLNTIDPISFNCLVRSKC